MTMSTSPATGMLTPVPVRGSCTRTTVPLSQVSDTYSALSAVPVVTCVVLLVAYLASEMPVVSLIPAAVQVLLLMMGAVGAMKLTLTAVLALVEMAVVADAESSKLTATCSVSLVLLGVAACRVLSGTVTATVPAAMSAAVSVTVTGWPSHMILTALPATAPVPTRLRLTTVPSAASTLLSRLLLVASGMLVMPTGLTMVSSLAVMSLRVIAPPPAVLLT